MCTVTVLRLVVPSPRMSVVGCYPLEVEWKINQETFSAALQAQSFKSNAVPPLQIFGLVGPPLFGPLSFKAFELFCPPSMVAAVVDLHNWDCRVDDAQLG